MINEKSKKPAVSRDFLFLAEKLLLFRPVTRALSVWYCPEQWL